MADVKLPAALAALITDFGERWEITLCPDQPGLQAVHRGDPAPWPPLYAATAEDMHDYLERLEGWT